MNALFANLIWATPDMFQSDSVFSTRVEALFAEAVLGIDLLTYDVKLAPAFEQEIADVTSSRAASIFAEEQFVGAVNLPLPVANDYAPEFDVIGQNRALLDNDFDAFLEQIAPEETLVTADLAQIDDLEVYSLSEDEDVSTAEQAATPDRPIDDTVWLLDNFTGLQVATLDDLG